MDRGKAVGRPSVGAGADGGLVLCLRAEGKSWREVAEAHPPVKSGKKKVRPSVGSIRRAWEACHKAKLECVSAGG